MLMIAASMEIVCQSVDYSTNLTFSVSTGGCVANCPTTKAYSTYFMGCVCDKDHITQPNGACTPSANVPARNQYIAQAVTWSNIAKSEINCPENLSLGYDKNGLAICGIPVKLPFGVYGLSKLGPCPSGMSISEFYGQCVNTTKTTQIDQAVQLCSSNNNRACVSIANLCAASAYNANVCANVPFSVSSRLSVFNYVRTQRQNYKQYDPAKTAAEQPKYDNIVSMTYALSNINGTVLFQSQFMPGFFDLCLLMETNGDPNLIQLQANSKPYNRDRRFHHNYSYYDMEMLTRAGFDADDVDYPGYYPTMFGNNYHRTCRMGAQTVMQIPQLFLSFYMNTETLNENKTSIINQDFMLPVKFNNRPYYSIALTLNQSNQTSVLNNLDFEIFGTAQNVTQPSITAKYSDPLPNTILLSPLLNKDISAYSFSNISISRNSGQQYVDISFQVRYRTLLPIDISYHFIACLLFGVLYELVFGGVLQLQKLQGAGSRGCNNNTRIKHIGVIALSILRGFAVSVYFDACLTFLLMMTDYRLSANQEYNRDNIIYCLTFFLYSLVNYAIRLYRLVISPTKCCLLDHRSSGGGQTGTSCWRRVFAANALRKLLSVEAVPFYVLSVTATFFIWCLDLQFASGDNAQLNTSIRNTTAVYFCPMLCFAFFISYVVIAAILMIYRFFAKNPFERFGDLLSMLDCSFFCFDGPHSCHFVYGKSPFGDTERPPEQLAKILKREAKGLYPRRGLHVGQAAQYFRIFFNKNYVYLTQLYKALQDTYAFETFDGEIGASIEGGSGYVNNRAFPQVPYCSPDRYSKFEALNEDLNVIIQQLSQEPVFYGSRFCKLIDVAPPRLPRQLNMLMVIDTTESLGPRALDDGHKLPGGYGTGPWFTQAFRYNLAFWDMLALCGIACTAAVAGSFGIGLAIGFIVVATFREAELVYMRRNLATTLFVPEALMK